MTIKKTDLMCFQKTRRKLNFKKITTLEIKKEP